MYVYIKLKILLKTKSIAYNIQYSNIGLLTISSFMAIFELELEWLHILQK